MFCLKLHVAGGACFRVNALKLWSCSSSSDLSQLQICAFTEGSSLCHQVQTTAGLRQQLSNVFLHSLYGAVEVIPPEGKAICCNQKLLKVPADVIHFDRRPVKLLNVPDHWVYKMKRLLEISEKRLLVWPVDLDSTKNWELWHKSSSGSDILQDVQSLVVHLWRLESELVAAERQDGEIEVTKHLHQCIQSRILLDGWPSETGDIHDEDHFIFKLW